MQDLQKQLEDIQKQINSFIYPITPLQTIKLDNLKKELKEIKYKLFIEQMKGHKNND